jgi:hypothetical protein
MYFGNVTEEIEKYSELPRHLRDPQPLVDDILKIKKDGGDQGRYSLLGIAASAAGSFGCLDLLDGFSAAVKDPTDRVEMLIHFTNHFPPPGSPKIFDAIYDRFQDVINEPSGHEGKTPLFYAMQLEVQGCTGVVESALRHGADPEQLTPEWAGTQTSPMELAKSKALSDILPTAGAGAHAEKECWRNIVAKCTEYSAKTDFRARIVKSFDGMWRE